jgi:hypothetical protein
MALVLWFSTHVELIDLRSIGLPSTTEDVLFRKWDGPAGLGRAPIQLGLDRWVYKNGELSESASVWFGSESAGWAKPDLCESGQVRRIAYNEAI